ncbi:U3 small nucleolar ribonucleoprotein protein IMP3 isoform X2 [Cryptomeria japonica]|uniref:U3 small nucleolar ribonucleoprotein protein IMP3 isoform X2 n=1 Tax=Cryptomeria japonica TaxID=3369 RepID=UPI0025ACC49C|nr:U3 small nucleolar ribonucleoprotein protein IMP3 isoform X2 [Cryptomeria japonica]
MRKLKFHEKKLLKKVNFLEWKKEGGQREALVMRRYHITGRDDYKKYSVLCGVVTKLVNILKQIDPKDPFRVEMTDRLLEKLRRLATVLVRLHFCESLKEAVTYIEQGHIRVGPDTVTDPAFLVTRPLEDFVTWVDTSKIRKNMLQYNERLDDYDLLN